MPAKYRNKKTGVIVGSNPRFAGYDHLEVVEDAVPTSSDEAAPPAQTPMDVAREIDTMLAAPASNPKPRAQPKRRSRARAGAK